MFFRNYSKPGKGVNKRDPNLPRRQVFFDILPRNIWKLVKLNLLYWLYLIPFFIVTMLLSGIISAQFINSFATESGVTLTNDVIVKYDLLIRFCVSFLFTVFLGQGPATSAMTFIVREYGMENNCWLISDFFDRFKSNFKQGILLWFLDLLVIFGGFIAITFYVKTGIVPIALLVAALINIYIIAHIYLYLMMVTYDLKLKDLLKNSVLIALGKLPQSLIILLSMLVVYAVIPYLALMFGKGLIFIVVLIAELIFIPTITAFTVNFSINPMLDKYVKIDE